MRECAACKRLFDDDVTLCPYDGASLVMSSLVGRVIDGRYRIDALLGSGGMGSVYRATQLNLDRTVAIKIISAGLADPAAFERFKREALVVARLRHPNIVSVFDFGAATDLGAYIVMEYLPGTSLNRELKRRGPLPVDEAIEIISQVCNAVTEAHASGVVHRDLKPHNIVLEATREGVRVKVLDFGIAKLWDDTGTDGASLTKTGAFLGTPSYMAPEQWSGEAADARLDVYALGCVFYELLTGKPPFVSSNSVKLLRMHTEQTPVPPSTHRHEIDAHVDAAVLRALAKLPDDRFQSPADFAEALEPSAATINTPAVLTRESTAESTSSITANTGERHNRPALVGRGPELTVLAERLDAALGGECQLVLISGDAGVGKTRLVDELEALARRRGVRTLHGRFAEADHALPYDGFFEVIREYLRTGAGSAATLAEIMPELLELFPMLAEIDSSRTPPTLTQQEPEDGGSRALDAKTSVFETLASTLSRISGGRPLVVRLEELHSANVSVEALQYAVRRLVTVPLFVVGTYRAADVDKRHPLARLVAAFRGDRRFAQIELGPLSEAAHRELVEAVLGGPAEGDLAARIYQVSEGNPYFATELAKSLKGSGDLTADGGEWHLTTGAGLLADALPETVQEAARQRIEELPDGARELLSIASVLGRDFDYDDLEALAPGEKEAEEAVETLVAKGFLEEDRRSRDDRLHFSSGVVREVLYAALPKRKRRSLHRRHAEQLEERYAGKLDRVLSALVLHYVGADESEKVFEYGIRLARRSLESHAADDAFRVAQIVLDFAREEGETETEGEVRLLLGDAHRMRGNVGAAVAEFEAAVKVFDQAGRGDRTLDAVERAADAAWDGRRAAQARRWVDVGIPAARAAGATERLVRLLSLGATIANLGGEYDRARAYSQEAAALRPATEGADEAPRGGRLVVALASELYAREPAELRFAQEFEVLANVYEPLLTWDARGGVAPRLAEAWEARDGGREFLFTLRRDVKLHDGRALTAREVAASLERAGRVTGRAIPAALSSVDRVEAVSDYELRIALAEPLPIFPSLLTDTRAAIACEPVDGGAFAVGTGPFLLRSLESDGALVERNDDYWGGAPLVDAVEFRVVRQSAERAASVRAGEVDVTGGLEPADLDALLSARPARTNFVEAPKKSICFLLFNDSGRAAAAPGAARALTGVVRVHDLVRSTLGRFAQPAEGLLPPGILGHDPGRRREPLSREVSEEWLRRSGLGPEPLRASISPAMQARYGALLDALFAEWSALGVTVSVETPTLATHVQSWEATSEFDFTLQEWEAGYDDPDDFTYTLFHSTHGLFGRYYSSPELDSLIEQARGESRLAAREGLYRRIEEQLLGSGRFLPLFHGVDYRVASMPVRRMALESAPPFLTYSRIAKGSGADAPARPGRAAIHIPLPSDFEGIDPCRVTSVAAIEASLAVFETLVRPDAEARVVPWLASEFQMEERGRRYRFRLRDGVRFHDGRRLTARDVRYSFERLLRSPGDYDQLLAPIRGAEAFANHAASELEGFRILSLTEFVLELERPLSILPALLTCAAAAIVPEDTVSASGTWQTGCVGTGPFRVAYTDGAGRLELEANPQYWRRGLPKSERLGYTAENESAARCEGYREGRYSVAWLLARADEEALLRDPEHAGRARRIPEIATTILLLNSKRGVLADEAARRRFVDALDVEAFVRRVEGQGAVPASGLIPPGLVGHEPRTVAKARALHDVPTMPLELTITMTPPLKTAWGEELVRWLGERGFRVRIVNETYAEHEAAVAAGAVDLVATGWNFDYPDADSITYGALHSSGRYGGNFVGSAELDRLIEAGRTETDAEARRAIYREIEAIVARGAFVVPLYHSRRWCFVGPDLEGVELNLFQPYLSYEKLYVKD